MTVSYTTQYEIKKTPRLGPCISSKMREGMGHVVHIQTSASCNNYEKPLLLLWYCQNKNGIGVWHRVHYIDMWHRYRYIGI